MSLSPTAVNLSDCTVVSSVEQDNNFPDYIFHVRLILKHPQLGSIASLHTLNIMRDRLRSNKFDFLSTMNAKSPEMHSFGATLFDNNGNAICNLIQKGGNQSGTGVWGKEMNVGDVIYLKELYVDGKHRKQGVGSYLLNNFFTNITRTFKDALVYCCADPIGINQNSEEWYPLKVKLVAFFRKNHFRRVGRTPFFAYSPNPNHPSRSIAPEADATLNISTEERTRKYPLHVAITSFNDLSIATILQAAYDADCVSIYRRDPDGDTPLHVASRFVNDHAVTKLLTWDMSRVLHDRANASGMTPLEAAVDFMEQEKEDMCWDGHPENGLSVEYRLKVAMGCEDVRGVTLEEYITKKKYGCTCGECADGWLSPRMRRQLTNQADLRRNAMWSEIVIMSKMKSQRVLKPSYIFSLPNGDFVDPSLHPSFTKTFYMGYYGVFKLVFSLLNDPSKPLPNPQTVLAQVSPEAKDYNYIMHFLNKGGKIEFVLDSITYHAKEESEGEGSDWEELSVDERLDDDDDDETMGLAQCENDDAFELVRNKIGLRDALPGPYSAEDALFDILDVRALNAPGSVVEDLFNILDSSRGF